MLRLLLLRHAKAERGEPGGSDHDRRLAERGRDDAPQIGAYMEKHGYKPDLAVVSTSARTRETWALVAKSLTGKPKAVFEDHVYEDTADTLLEAIRETGSKVKTLLIVGHNPTMHELAVELTATGDIDMRQRLHEGMPTSGLAVIEFSLDSWKKLHAHSGRLEHFVTPRSLADD